MRMSRERVTMHDVAEAAGVTPGTVSRALRSDPLVNENTRLRVVEIARRMHYLPNLSARALKTGSAGTLALASPSGPWIFQHPHFAPIHTGFIGAAAEDGVRVTIYVTPAGRSATWSVEKDAWPLQMLNGLLDGCLIYQAHSLSLESVRYLRDARLAVVLMNVESEIPGFFQVLGNAEQRIRESVRWARELGARRVGVLGLAQRMEHSNAAMLKGAQSVGRIVKVDFQTVDDYDSDEPAAVDVALKALLVKRPSALIFNSAFHVMHFLRGREQGRFPNDKLRLFFYKPLNAPMALPNLHYMEADLMGSGRLGYSMIKDAQTGKAPRVARLDWKREAK